MYLPCIPAHFHSHSLATGVFPKRSEASSPVRPAAAVSPTWESPGQVSVHLVPSLYYGRDQDWLLWRQVEESGGRPWSSLCSGAVSFQPPRHALCDSWLPQPAGPACGIHLQRLSGAGTHAELWVVGMCGKKSWQAAGNASLCQLGGPDSARTKGKTISRAFFPHIIDWEAPSEVLLCLPSAQGTCPWWVPCKADAWLVKGKQGVSRSTPRQKRARSGWWLVWNCLPFSSLLLQEDKSGVE